MSDKKLDLTPESIVGIVNADERKRVPLGRYMTREPVSTWRVRRFDDGKTLVLEAVES